MSDWWQDDERLAAELRDALREQADVPESIGRIGRDAYAWRTIDAELALLQAEPADAGLRAAEPAGDEPRSLTFATDGLTVVLELAEDAVRGQLDPPQAGVLRVRFADDTAPGPMVAADEVGWFVLRPRPAGRFRLHVRTAAGLSVLTDWIDPS